MTTEHSDVLIIGAGLSGIGAACHLINNCPRKSYTILESRASLGGTWDLFKYPGIRSDSDMFTLGYSFKPWTENKAVADGKAILSYIKETAREYDVTQHIHYNSKAEKCSWDSKKALWTISTTVQKADGSSTEKKYTAKFVFFCSGYYNYDNGYTPEFKNSKQYQGQFIHPQQWPEDLDYTDKNITIIGSGATAVTLVPSLAKKAAHVTMLQRSPTYVIALPNVDPIANLARKLLPAKLAYAATRVKNISLSMFMYQISRRHPEMVKKFLKDQAQKALGADFDVDTHFTPSYDPWDQRLCLDPNGAFFKAINEKHASVMTDHIEHFTKNGIMLKSGKELKSDIIVSATGLNLLALGGATIEVDGKPITLSETFGYKGMMLTGVPNMAIFLGYTNASWTLKTDLTAKYLCRLINHMDKKGFDYCAPENEDTSMESLPFLDLSSGYVSRSIDNFPKQGLKKPWRLYQNYVLDFSTLRLAKVTEKAMKFYTKAEKIFT